MITQDVLGQLAQDLKHFARTDTIFGEPMELQGTTIIPVCKVSVGYGGGGGEGEGTAEQKPSGKGTGGGGGGGVRVEPSALIIARNGEISVVGIGARRAAFEGLIERVPELVEKLRPTKAKDSAAAKADE